MQKSFFNQRIIRILAIIMAISGQVAGFGFAIDIFAPSSVQAASGDNRPGILGQLAPELDLTAWIDGEGRKMDSVRLSTMRGKVVYLYFFQDW